jgi:hypothetical protein
MIPVTIIAAIVMPFPAVWITPVRTVVISKMRPVMRAIVMPVITLVVMTVAVVRRITVAIARTAKVEIYPSMSPDRGVNTKIEIDACKRIDGSRVLIISAPGGCLNRDGNILLNLLSGIPQTGFNIRA